MEAPAIAPNLLKYLFLAGLYLFIIGLVWVLLRQVGQFGASPRDKLGARAGEQVATGKHGLRARRGVPVLIVEGGSLNRRRFPIERELTIGRSPSNSIVLSHRFVSSHHATVRLQGNEVLLVDEGSTNGTFLNGSRITAASRLKPGDAFVVGDTTFRLAQE
jgi:hypothetical protein